MRRAVLTLVLALCALPVAAAEEQPNAPKDMMLLTVSGTIGEGNRGALDAKKDSLLALQKVDFSKAFAFDRAMLLGLEQGTVRAQPRNSTNQPRSKGRCCARCSAASRRRR
jgi:hypothetical protein